MWYFRGSESTMKNWKIQSKSVPVFVYNIIKGNLPEEWHFSTHLYEVQGQVIPKILEKSSPHFSRWKKPGHANTQSQKSLSCVYKNCRSMKATVGHATMLISKLMWNQWVVLNDVFWFILEEGHCIWCAENRL